MNAVTDFSPSRTVTSKEALRHWKALTDRALREPVVITAHGRPRHVLMAYEDYERLRDQERQAWRAADLPAELAGAILADLAHLRAPAPSHDDGDTIVG